LSDILVIPNSDFVAAPDLFDSHGVLEKLYTQSRHQFKSLKLFRYQKLTQNVAILRL
jgi:hypothetical protein